jgi:transposase InsO family protein
MNDAEIRMRLGWVKLYQETGDAGYVCRRCGISRPTLRKWHKRYQEQGIEGLRSKSRRPINSPSRKIFKEQEKWILELRNSMNIGARRIQNELLRQYNFQLSLASIQKVLDKHSAKPIRKVKRRKQIKRYQKEIPGERVQMDTCKIRPGMYQFTAVDDCTRYLVAEIYPRRAGKYTMQFLETLVDEMPFPIQRIQTDRGTEFFAHAVQDRLLEWGIKFRPTPPASPHLNGKVERVQQTILLEFYALANLDAPDLSQQLAEWVHFYNWYRKHGSIKTTPSAKVTSLHAKTPYWDEVVTDFDPGKERIRAISYLDDQALGKLK